MISAYSSQFLLPVPNKRATEPDSALSFSTPRGLGSSNTRKDLFSSQALPAKQFRGGPPRVKGKPFGWGPYPTLDPGPRPPQPPKAGEGLGESGLEVQDYWAKRQPM
jgi:hypothetical protein